MGAERESERWGHHAEVHRLEALALALDAQEKERRLDGLNHAHEQAREKERDFIPRETYEGSMAEIKRTLDDIRGTLGITLPREVFDQYQKEAANRLELALEASDRRLKPLEAFHGRALGFGALLAVVSAAVGAAISRALG